MRMDTPPSRDMPSAWPLALAFLDAILPWVAFLIVTALLALAVTAGRAEAAAIPPPVRLARALSSEQCARAIARAPSGATVSMPASACRAWTQKQQYAAGEACLSGGTVYVCVQSHTSGKTSAPAASPKLWSASGAVQKTKASTGGRGRAAPEKNERLTWKRF